MAESHLTVRVSKKFLFIAAILIVGAVAFGAGVFVSGSNSESSAPTSTVSVESTTTSVETTVASSTTSPSKPKPKKPASTTTQAPQASVAPLSVDVSYSDTCQPTTPAGALGTMTLSWTSVSAVRVRIQLQHGNDFSSDENGLLNGSKTVERPCNNDNGRPRPVVYIVTAFDANGAQQQDGGNDSM